MHRQGFFLRRLGRKLLWRYPALYRRFGLWRNRGDCRSGDFDVWIEGYPRSANTFAVSAFELANPGVRVRSHRHIPTFVLEALAADKPGFLLMRRPAEAAISWAIFWNERLDRCLDYYVDFHAVLRPHASRLLLAPFETVTTQFDRVIVDLNARFGTAYLSRPHDETTIAECFARIEDKGRCRVDGLNERRVCRPSPQRVPLQAELRQVLANSAPLQRKLARANDLYEYFLRQGTVAPARVPAASPVTGPDQLVVDSRPLEG